MNDTNHNLHQFAIGKDELIVDNFAGGGGASLGIGMALGRSPDIAINHDPEAIAMHAANHPETKHYCEDVWHVNPIEACDGWPVGLAWFSPDCKHFSKAKGGKPVSKKIRGLAWVVIRWAKAVKPRVIILENVEEFKHWGPITADGMPCPIRKGQTFRRWKSQLENLGYRVDLRELRASDYGTPTIRKRLFIVARCDDLPIRWPEPTHGDPKKICNDLFSTALKPWRTAAECIDWSLECPSIFERHRPLAENTLRRIAAGIRRFVIESTEPFIVNLTHHGSDRVESLDEPFKTITGANRGEKAICIPTLVQIGYGERDGQAPRVPGLDKPLGTVVAGGTKHALVSPILVGTGGPTYSGKPRSTKQPLHTMTTDSRAAIVSAFLAQHNTTGNGKPNVGHEASTPFSTITSSGSHQSIITSHLLKLHGTCKDGQSVIEPVCTLRAQGTHIGEVRAFLVAYYGNERDGSALTDPMRTTTSKERFGLVTVHGEDYIIVDIGLRMLTPPELYRAQGFPADYLIAPEVGGKRLSKTAQVRMCGNSVCPPIAAAVARAQFEPRVYERAA